MTEQQEEWRSNYLLTTTSLGKHMGELIREIHPQGAEYLLMMFTMCKNMGLDLKVEDLCRIRQHRQETQETYVYVRVKGPPTKITELKKVCSEWDRKYWYAQDSKE